MNVSEIIVNGVIYFLQHYKEEHTCVHFFFNTYWFEMQTNLIHPISSYTRQVLTGTCIDMRSSSHKLLKIQESAFTALENLLKLFLL